MLPYKRLIEGIKSIVKPFKVGTEETTLTPQTALPPQNEIRHIPTRIPRPEHNVSRSQISKSALKVLYQLHHAGYQAFLVGGCVRDLLLNITPKDFDVVTNAHPEEVKSLFRNCRLIGRRFVLAHVHFGREIIEVATFRAHHADGEGGSMVNGRIVRDNVYGGIDEDAWRRDFTINALYYDISDFALLDYAHGMQDIQDGVLRLIGDPILRYQEDPVRMLRAIRFAAKLGFQIEAAAAEPIPQLKGLLAGVPKARLFEEVQKLFLTGHAAQSLIQLRQHQLFPALFAETERSFSDPVAESLVMQALQNTDERMANQQPVTAAFLLAAVMWPPVAQLLPKFREQGLTEQDALLAATQQVMEGQLLQLAIPRRILTQIQEIWLLQPRLTRRRHNRKSRGSIANNPRFRAGYDFLLLRASAGEPVQVDVDAWTQFLAQQPQGSGNHHTTTATPNIEPDERDEQPHSRVNHPTRLKRRRRKPRKTDQTTPQSD